MRKTLLIIGASLAVCGIANVVLVVLFSGCALSDGAALEREKRRQRTTPVPRYLTY